MKPVKLIVIAFALATAGLAACDRPTNERGVSTPAPVAPPPAARPANPTVGQDLDDATITGKVKAALLAEKGISGAGIEVDTTKGVVTLSGRVPEVAQIERAAQVARSVDGVTTVQNKLTAG